MEVLCVSKLEVCSGAIVHPNSKQCDEEVGNDEYRVGQWPSANSLGDAVLIDTLVSLLV